MHKVVGHDRLTEKKTTAMALLITNTASSTGKIFSERDTNSRRTVAFTLHWRGAATRMRRG